VDHATGLALYEKNADAPLRPPSMSKLMTLYMLFERSATRGDARDEFSIQPKAQAMGGSRMIPSRKTVSVAT
jgi:D-alanyl-D-alanine carboxypeptidase (penicillin-binding protein 5/6)